MAVDDTLNPVEGTAAGAARQIAVPQHAGTETGHPAPLASDPAGTTSASLHGTVPAALDLGWTMADLAAAVAHLVTIGDLERILPTEHELDRLRHSRLQAVRISCLSATLGGLLPAGTEPMPAEELASLQNEIGRKRGRLGSCQVRSDLEQLHLRLLDTLACAGRPLILAYQLGRSLRDTTYLPDQERASELEGKAFDPEHVRIPKTVAKLRQELRRDRVGTLQGWLDALAPDFPADTVAVVKTSLGRWSDWSAAALDDAQPGALTKKETKDALVNVRTQALLQQGDVNLLVGTQSLDGLLTPEARVAAGEAALARSARIIRRVVRHYWVAIALLVLAAAGLTAWAGVYLTGAGKVWTQIATIGSALGITAKGIGNRIARLAGAGERPIYQAETIDAYAWAITAIPSTTLDSTGSRS
ncbi:MAG: hypothetical protein ACRDYY_04685 [Acidimicrobiales bacterium]